MRSLDSGPTRLVRGRVQPALGLAVAALLSLAGCKAEPPPLTEGAPSAGASAEAPPAAPESPAAAGEEGGGAAPADKSDPAKAEAEPPPEPEGPVVPDEPHDVLIVGGSLAATGFGVLLERRLDAHPHIKAHRKAKSATGLSRPDFYDWMAEGKRQIELRSPDMVVVIMGGNDGQDLVSGSDGKDRVRWDTTEWSAAYRQRVDEFLHVIAAEDRMIVWLGLPRTNTRKYETKLDLLRAIHRAAVEALGPHGVYVDTSELLQDPDGNLMKQVQMQGKTFDLRMDDGIHFSMKGSEFFAEAVYPRLLDILKLEDATE